VEVPVRDEDVVVHQHERVVGRSVELGADGVRDVVEEVARGAMHLRGAAERVRVLHLVAPAMRLDDGRTLEQAQDVRCGHDLPAQPAQLVDAGVKARARALQRLDALRTREVGRLDEPARAHDSKRAERGHELGAVDERQPLLRP
jgi:hypothetical protein